jgi:hypothetical protein
MVEAQFLIFFHMLHSDNLLWFLLNLSMNCSVGHGCGPGRDLFLAEDVFRACIRCAFLMVPVAAID